MAIKIECDGICCTHHGECKRLEGCCQHGRGDLTLKSVPSPKFKRGDRVEVNDFFWQKQIQKANDTPEEFANIITEVRPPPFWVPLWGFDQERDMPHKGTLGTVLGYQVWYDNIEFVRVNVADTQVHLFSEEVLDVL